MTTEFRPSATPPTELPLAAPNQDQNGSGNGSSDEHETDFTLKYRGVAYGSKFSDDIVVTHRSRLGWLQWFSNLSVGKKQLTGLFASEVISVLGLVGVGSFLIISGGRSQLLNQARAELSVTDIGYNIKINQMGFGFRGQSDNQAIVDVATADAAGETVSAVELATVREILQNEIERYRQLGRAPNRRAPSA